MHWNNWDMLTGDNANEDEEEDSWMDEEEMYG